MNALFASLPDNLPRPDPQAMAHGEKVATALGAALDAAGGALPFARFMELVLYAPGLGYYSAGSRKFGEGGDFVTAPEISPLFSRALAGQYRRVLEGLGGGDILELGAGTGRMAADSLAELEHQGALPDHYLILELSAELRQRQRETLASAVPHLLARVAWLEQIPDPGFRGVMVGNEVLDAMPVRRFRARPQGVVELGVCRAGDGFGWCEMAPDAALAKAVAKIRAVCGGEWPADYESEVNLSAAPWIEALGARLEAGLLLLIDYGFPRREFYLPERSGGTLMCHYRHRAHPDPLILPGLQDITAHVDFTAVAEAGVAAGLTLEGYTTQACFLLGANVQAPLEDPDLELRQRLELAAGVKRLLLPDEMGELFKVIGLSRGLDGVGLEGFAVRDMRHKL